LPDRIHLLDVNVLVALTHEDHQHHLLVMNWFDRPGLQWSLCPFSEAGFLRVATNPKVGNHSVNEATEVLASLREHPGYSFWPVSDDWATLTASFQQRVFGHQQITDAYLLGLAVKEDGTLVTMDKAIRYLAGTRCSQNVLLLE